MRRARRGAVAVGRRRRVGRIRRVSRARNPPNMLAAYKSNTSMSSRDSSLTSRTRRNSRRSNSARSTRRRPPRNTTRRTTSDAASARPRTRPPSAFVSFPYNAANAPIVHTVLARKPPKYPHASAGSRSDTAGRTPRTAPGPAAPWTTPTVTASAVRVSGSYFLALSPAPSADPLSSSLGVAVARAGAFAVDRNRADANSDARSPALRSPPPRVSVKNAAVQARQVAVLRRGAVNPTPHADAVEPQPEHQTPDDDARDGLQLPPQRFVVLLIHREDDPEHREQADAVPAAPPHAARREETDGEREEGDAGARGQERGDATWTDGRETGRGGRGARRRRRRRRRRGRGRATNESRRQRAHPSQNARVGWFPHDNVATAAMWSAPVTTCRIPMRSPPPTAAIAEVGWMPIAIPPRRSY